MRMSGTAFPLRFRKERIRALVRELAEREGISQNELLEQAAEHEVIARGALLADDLQASLEQLRSATKLAHADIVNRSIVAFAEGEATADPLPARQISPPGTRRRRVEPVGAVSAFRHRA